MSDSVRPHRGQPTSLLRPWDSPCKSTGVGCHFLLQCMKVESEREVAQSCLTPSDPMDCSLPGFSVHGIFQARVLDWGATAFSACSPKRHAESFRHYLPEKQHKPLLRSIICFWNIQTSHFPSPLPNTHPPPAIPLRALGTHQLLARIPSLLGTDLKSFQIILGFKYSGAKLQCHLTQRLHNGVQ